MSLRIKRDRGNDNRYQCSKKKYRKIRLCTLQFLKSSVYYNYKEINNINNNISVNSFTLYLFLDFMIFYFNCN